MIFKAPPEIVSMIDGLRADSVAPTVPWGLNPVAVGAIASSVSAVITASALIVAVRTYLRNSRVAARSQAELVTVYRTRSTNTQIINDIKYRLVEILITNSNETAILNLCLLLHSMKRVAKLDDPSGINWGPYASHEKSTFAGARGLWTLRDGAVIPPGVSTLRVYLNDDQLQSRIGVGFLDQNGRKWTRWLDGELVEGWKPDDTDSRARR